MTARCGSIHCTKEKELSSKQANSKGGCVRTSHAILSCSCVSTWIELYLQKRSRTVLYIWKYLEGWYHSRISQPIDTTVVQVGINRANIDTSTCSTHAKVKNLAAICMIGSGHSAALLSRSTNRANPRIPVTYPCRPFDCNWLCKAASLSFCASVDWSTMISAVHDWRSSAEGQQARGCTTCGRLPAVPMYA
jgi:hypothetical protein